MERRHKVIAEYDVDEGLFFVMWPDGTVHTYLKAREVLAAVRRHDTAESRRCACVVITTLEWRNVPAGFQPPR